MKLRTAPSKSTLVFLLLVFGCDGGTGPDRNQVASVTVSPPSSTVGIGNTVQLSVQVRNSKGALLTLPASWSTSAGSVATCSGSGLVTGIGEGTATITATVGAKSGTASITVVDLSLPSQPSEVSATPLSNSDVQVTWTDNSGNEDDFRIDREQAAGGVAGTDGGPARVFAEVGSVGPNVTTYLDSGLQSGISYRYRVRACNGNGCSDPVALQNEVTTFPELVIETTHLPVGVVGTAYSQTLVATSGAGALAWSVTAGALPDGLSLSGTGVLSGTPTTTRLFEFTVQVSGGGQTVTQALSIRVTLPPLEVFCDGPTAGSDCTLSVAVVPDFVDVYCTDGAGNNSCPSSGQLFFGQDGNYSINPESYTHVSSGDARLIEAVSGLTWATPSYLTDSYSAATGACSALTAIAYGGETDWRVPSLREVGRIISKGIYVGVWPRNMDFVPNSVWWTSTPDKADGAKMIGISGNWPFTFHLPAAGGAGELEGARRTYCVSGAIMAGAWEVNADAVTVTHTTTGLMWHRSASANQTMDWGSGLQYCEDSEVGGFTDWRLPTLREYVSVFDLSAASGYMSEAFGTEPTAKMMTGTPNTYGDPSYIAEVREDTGILEQTALGTLVGAARCVRGPY